MHPVAGLTTHEATKRLKIYGLNELSQNSGRSAFGIFLTQFQSVLVVILILATVLSLAAGDIIDGLLILIIIFLNATLGFLQEYKAERAIKALKKITTTAVRVIRDGVEQLIDSHLLVPGDSMLIGEGDKIAADATLLTSLHLEVNEAPLTGESVPVEKNHNNPESHHIYMGTIVARGRGVAQVLHTGMLTKLGAIAKELSAITEEKTPLEKKINQIGKYLGVLAIAASLLLVFLGVAQGNPLLEILLTSSSLAVAAVPEGLPAVITITLAIGMQRMAKRRAILRKLAAIEALGSITVIATDKTGTLTMNKMKGTKVWLSHSVYVREKYPALAKLPLFEDMCTVSAVCNTASLTMKHDGEDFDVLGDSTEGALLLLAAEQGRHPDHIKREGTLIDEFAFDPIHKLMSVVWKKSDAKSYLVAVKGAPETIMPLCTNLATSRGVEPMSPENRRELDTRIEQFAKDGLRVIALANRHTNTIPNSRQDAEHSLTLIGVVGISDPARPEVPGAITQARRAGIRTIMITGDNPLTADAIGKKIGLIEEGDEVITGDQLGSLSAEALISRIGSIRIFARTTPEQKLRIVKALQKMGETVAVTGDGVNDSLALKQADVGVAMGITGTDVAKEASDMIITDDNFATIVTAVSEGRTIFENMKSSTKYLIGSNVGEVASIIAGTLFGWPLILTPIQILFVNLVTDGLPALGLAVTPKTKSIMTLAPRRNHNILELRDVVWLGEIVLLTTVATLGSFYIGTALHSLAMGRTLAFISLIMTQQGIYLDLLARSHSVMTLIIEKSALTLLPVASVALLFLLINIPVLSSTFEITLPTAELLIVSVLLSSLVLFFSELRKRLAHTHFYSR